MYKEVNFKTAYQGAKEGLNQMTNEHLQRILDHEGDMIGNGSVMLGGVG